jgi:ankyrin repeat protein
MRIELRHIGGEKDAPELWRAAYYGRLARVEKLLLVGRDPDERGSARLCTPLHAAALMGHHEVVSVLLSNTKNPSNVNARDIHGLTPLQYAACRLMTKAAEVLIKYKADVSAIDNLEFAPVWLAASALIDLDPDISYGAPIPRIIGVDADVDQDYDEIDTARLEMVRKLLQAGAQLQYFQWNGPKTMIWELAIESHADTRLLEMLIKHSFDGPPRTPDGGTIAHAVVKLPYMKCRYGEDCDILKLLEPYEINSKNHKGRTPLFFAVQRNKVDTVEYLLQTLHASLPDDDKIFTELVNDVTDDMWDILKISLAKRGRYINDIIPEYIARHLAEKWKFISEHRRSHKIHSPSNIVIP